MIHYFLHHHMKRLCGFMLAVFTLSSSLVAEPIFSYDARFHPVLAKNGMVATQESIATDIGAYILKQGGNAVDAAVAVGFALAVTLPRAGNLGGGGFMLIHLADDNKTVALDYREKAPLAATRNMFLDEEGNVDTNAARFSLKAVGVPGTVAGLADALEKYGTMPLAEVIAPAIQLAEFGIPVSYDLERSIDAAKERLSKHEASKAIFLDSVGNAPKLGDVLVQKKLAATLKELSENGKSAFYEGDIAKKIVTFMSKNDGLITSEDLKTYTPVWRDALVGEYRDYTIYTMPPPSSGGIHLLQMLNVLEAYPINRMGHNTAQSIHLMTETMKLAYADRSKYLGDPDYVNVPTKELISKTYANTIRPKIKLSFPTPSKEIKPGELYFSESNETTHYSIVDKWGNAVSNTYTLNFSYGTGITVPGTGILLNNQMDDFSAKPGEPNAYGLIGGAYNSIEAGKRMLSSMTPTIVMKDGKVFLVTGSPGGSRIITTVLQTIMNVIDHDMNIAEATAAPRFHHQWFPDEIRYEKGISDDTIAVLKRKGHSLVLKPAMGSAQSIMKVGDVLYGASDTRKPGAKTEGY